MEENLRPDHYLETLFGLKERDYTQYSPLTLAYIGDAVFELAVRTVLVREANRQASKLHKEASSVVRAPAQAKMLSCILPHLTEQEAAVCRRARNAKPATKAKNATLGEYMEATAFEAVIGWLYLEKQYNRALYLIELAMTESGHRKKGTENDGSKRQ